MSLFLEILGAFYLLAFGFKLCVALGRAYEAVRDVADEDRQAWNNLRWYKKLQAFVECVILEWVMLPMFWLGDRVKGLD